MADELASGARLFALAVHERLIDEPGSDVFPESPMRVLLFVLLTAVALADPPQPVFSIFQVTTGTNMVRVLPGGVISNQVIFVAEFYATQPTDISVSLRP